jgi:hypothetical protein
MLTIVVFVMGMANHVPMIIVVVALLLTVLLYVVEALSSISVVFVMEGIYYEIVMECALALHYKMHVVSVVVTARIVLAVVTTKHVITTWLQLYQMIPLAFILQMTCMIAMIIV